MRGQLRFATSLFLLLLTCLSRCVASELRISVYCTAGEVRQILESPDGKQRVLRAIQPLGVSRLFLEGRRGDEYVPPDQLRELRGFFAGHKIECSGGIATVPGAKFGARQTGGLDWLNWENANTRANVAEFFTQNAPVFDELIVDDFFCTGDISPEAERARGTRTWGEYRRDLLTSLVPPMMIAPTRAANRHTRLILKYPQWYDRFHLFGYDPLRMSPQFEQVWVGTEVRDPNTRRWGFVPPTEGYMNFRWLAAVAGQKVRGAWFDHIECSAQNFVDQACQSVLAGAQELTLFHLGDLLQPHPGDTLLASRMPELRELAARVQGQRRRGIPFYKPPGSESSENMYLADYLGMIGLPILPVGKYPADAKVAFLPVQAAADATLFAKMQRHLSRGATLVVTPALVRALGSKAAQLAGVAIEPAARAEAARTAQIRGEPLALDPPLEADGAVQSPHAETLVTLTVNGQPVPWLTRQRVGRGQLLLLNVRTFSESDFRATGEWLLAPKQLGLPRIPQSLADTLRASLLAPLGLDFRAPAGIELVLVGKAAGVYSFREDSAHIQFGSKVFDLPPHEMVWLK